MPDFKLKFTAPDFTRDPKTDCWCCVCQKDIKGTPSYYIHLISGCMALHPDEESRFVEDKENKDYGFLPIGSTCAKRLGLEWVHLEKPAA